MILIFPFNVIFGLMMVAELLKPGGEYFSGNEKTKPKKVPYVPKKGFRIENELKKYWKKISNWF